METKTEREDISAGSRLRPISLVILTRLSSPVILLSTELIFFEPMNQLKTNGGVPLALILKV